MLPLQKISQYNKYLLQLQTKYWRMPYNEKGTKEDLMKRYNRWESIAKERETLYCCN